MEAKVRVVPVAIVAPHYTLPLLGQLVTTPQTPAIALAAPS